MREKIAIIISAMLWILVVGCAIAMILLLHERNETERQLRECDTIVKETMIC